MRVARGRELGERVGDGVGSGGITFVNHFNDASPLHHGAVRRPNKQCVIRAREWEIEMVRESALRKVIW